MLGWLIGMAGVACGCQGSRDYWGEQTAEKIFARAQREESASTGESFPKKGTLTLHSAGPWLDPSTWWNGSQSTFSDLQQNPVNTLNLRYFCSTVLLELVFTKYPQMQWNNITLLCTHSCAVMSPVLNRQQWDNSYSAGLHMTEVAPESTWLMMLLKELWFHDEVI